MNKRECYEHGYPWWIVTASNAVSVSVIITGALIVSRLGISFLLLFTALCLWTELKVLRTSCVRCYYYGKRCAFGKGILSARLFRQEKPDPVIKRIVTWKDILPDFALAFLPIVVGIGLLVRDFTWVLLAEVIFLCVLISSGNGWIRGTLACPRCKQKKAGCPALEFFEKTKKSDS